MIHQWHWSANNVGDKPQSKTAAKSDATTTRNRSRGEERLRFYKEDRNLSFIELTKLASGAWQLCAYYKDTQQPARQIFDDRSAAIGAYLDIWPPSRAL